MRDIFEYMTFLLKKYKKSTDINEKKAIFDELVILEKIFVTDEGYSFYPKKIPYPDQLKEFFEKINNV